MSKLQIQQFSEFSGEHIELYWFVGFEQNVKESWFVRTVVRGMESGKFHMMQLPIGLLPMLSLGQVFSEGELLSLSAKGLIETLTINDVSQFEEITSADIPQKLYSFEGREAGVQRLFRYKTSQGEVLIPAIELIRYLFLHNRVLANALMRPGAINLLFHPEAPGYHPNLVLRFTAELPKHCLSHKFAQEFAWIALDSQARRAWDSVYLLSHRRQYVSFVPPALKNSAWTFRGVQHGNTWLVLELLHLTGKQQPCDKLSYGHPTLKQVIRTLAEKPRIVGTPGGDEDTNASQEKVVYDYQLDDGQLGSKSDIGQKAMDFYSKQSDFDRDINIEKLLIDVEVPAGKGSKAVDVGPAKIEKRQIIKVSAGEQIGNASLPSLEFKLLAPAKWESMGDQQALANTVRRMSEMLPEAQFAMSLCQIKGGRVFSLVNRTPRTALVVTITLPASPPIVLLDVDRTGEVALSLIVLRYKSYMSFKALEESVKLMLDGLVDASGHWDNEVECLLEKICTCERLPRVLTPRDKADSHGQVTVWSMKLLDRLGLRKEV